MPNAPLAVFTRNHRKHLDEALSIAKQEPDREITFRSRQRWARPAAELSKGREPVVYLAVVEEGNLVRYKARLRALALDPVAGHPEVKRLLTHESQATAGEGLWSSGSSNVLTLYSISNLDAVTPPFDQTVLKKFYTGEPIAAAYSRAYCLVQEKP